MRKTSNTLPEFSSSEDDSDSDDCQVLSWCPAQKKPVSHSIQREPEHNAKKVYSPESSQCSERENESSDIEIMRGSQGVIRRQWEEAALKRRMGRVMQSEGSKAGRNSRRGQPSNLGRRNSASSPPGSKEQGVSEPAQRAHDTHQQHGPVPSQGLAESVATSTDSDGQIGIESRVRGERGVDVVPCASSYEEQLPDIGAISTGREQSHQVFPNSPRGLQEVPVEIATLFPGRPSGRDLAEELDDQYLQGEPCGWMQNWFEERVTSHRIDGACTSRQDEFKGMTEGGLLASKVIPDLNIREGQAAETKSEALIGSGIIGEREKMKQSVEFQRADEEEWARRDLELQRQVIYCLHNCSPHLQLVGTWCYSFEVSVVSLHFTMNFTCIYILTVPSLQVMPTGPCFFLCFCLGLDSTFFFSFDVSVNACTHSKGSCCNLSECIL